MKLKNKKKSIIICSIIILLGVFLYWQNNDLVVSNYTYCSEKITEELDGYKIVQISDLHNKEFGSHNKKLINKVKKEKPDIIVITGDLVDSGHTDLDIALDTAKQMVDIAPVYYVSRGLGNSIIPFRIFNRPEIVTVTLSENKE